MGESKVKKIEIKTSVQAFGTLCVATAISLGSSYLAATKGSTLFTLISWFVPIAVILLAVFGSFLKFGEETKVMRVLFIACSYLSLIICFAASYYTMCYMFDKLEAEADYSYYKSQGQAIKEGRHEDIGRPRYDLNWQAFNGMQKRLWDINTTFPGNHIFWNLDRSAIPQALFIKACMSNEMKDVVKRTHDSDSFSVKIDCLHFSVATITTLGYGDITPNNNLSKIASDIEALSGLFLFVVTLGLVLSREGPQDEPKLDSN